MTTHPPGGTSTKFVLPERLTPLPERAGLDEPFWQGLQSERLVVQRCTACRRWQWGPEWLCRHCHAFSPAWEEVPRQDGVYPGLVYSWERVWHPTDRALADAVPYIAVLVALPTAGDIRFVGNLVGDPLEDISIGAPLRAVFEHHETHSLVQWERR